MPNKRLEVEIDDGYVGTINQVARRLGCSDQAVYSAITYGCRCKGHYVEKLRDCRIATTYDIYDLEGNLIDRAKTSNQIAVWLGTSSSYVTNCCKKHKPLLKEYMIVKGSKKEIL